MFGTVWYSKNAVFLNHDEFIWKRFAFMNFPIPACHFLLSAIQLFAELKYKSPKIIRKLCFSRLGIHLWYSIIFIFSVPESKSPTSGRSGENKVLKRNDSGISTTSAKQYYLKQSRYVPGKKKLFNALSDSVNKMVCVCMSIYACLFHFCCLFWQVFFI